MGYIAINVDASIGNRFSAMAMVVRNSERKTDIFCFEMVMWKEPGLC